MTEYRITMREQWQQPGADASPYIRFYIADGEAIGTAAIRVSGTAQALGALRDIDWQHVLSIAVLEEAENQLEAGVLSREAGADLKMELGSYDEEFIIELARQPKRCQWQRPAHPRGKLCTATASGKPEPTTSPLCASCEMPDARLVCSALVHPTTKYQTGVGFIPAEGEGFVSDPARGIERAYCELRLQPQEWSQCQPWSGKECWHRIVEAGTKPPRPDEAAPRRLVDEIPYLRLAYAEHFQTKGSRFWPGVDERAVASVLTDCATAADFQQRLASLDALITRMEPQAQLEPSRRVGEKGNKIGSLTALGRVLEDRCGGGALPHVERLRALRKARNSFPAHPGSDDLPTALRSLGIEHYPPRDWKVAWWQVAASVAESVAAFRVVIQNTATDDRASN